MAWTASVTNVDKQPSIILVTIRYADGTNTVDETHKLYGPPDAGWLERTTGAKIAQLDGLAGTTIPAGTPGTWADPDPQYTAFIDALRKLGRVKLLLDTGVLLPTDQQVIDFIALCRSKVFSFWNRL